MEGLRKGSLFPFLEKGRGVERPVSPLPAHPGADAGGCRLPVSARPRRPASRERPVLSRAMPFSPGDPLFCKFCLLPDGRWAICPCAPLLAALPEARHGDSHAVRRSHRACDPFGGPVPFPSMVRRSGACPFAYRPGCPGGAGSGMTRERPGKSGFSGRGQKKHCLLPRLGIWTFDCVREVAAWGR